MEYWEPTQRVLQGEIPLVRRPKLTDTLLRKPPFRFLHDVISEVCRTTGYAKGLFSAEELISTNIKDKESKVAYLWKIIDCIGITLHANVPVRPLKIVAGLEPEQTNVFLQMLAAATMMDVETCERAVARVLAGEKQPPPGQAGMEWIQVLKEMMSPRASHSPPELPQRPEIPKQHSAADNQRPAKRVSDQDTKTEGITISETVTPLQTPSPPIVPSFSSELKGDSLQLSKKTSKSASPATGMPPQPTAKSSQPHDFQTVPVPPSGSKSFNNPSPGPTPSQRTGPKESPTKKRQSKPTAGAGQKKRDSAVKTSDDTGSSELAQQVSCSVGEEARSAGGVPSHTGIQITTTGTADDLANEGEILLQNLAEIDLSAVSPAAVDAPLPLKDTSVTEEKCSESAVPRARTPAVVDRVTLTMGPRPQSARKAPPALRCNIDKGGAKLMQGTSMERPASEKPSARESGRKPSIILDTELREEDEQDNMPSLLPPQNTQETILTSLEGAGKLVRDILENKEELQDQGCITNGDEHTGIILGRIRGSSVKKEDTQTKEEEIQKLREAVQILCQTANPLGKSMDYLQEDVEVMSKEYQFWIKERDKYRSKLEQEKRVTEDMLQAESGRVFELEEEISQQHRRINTFKAQVECCKLRG